MNRLRATTALAWGLLLETWRSKPALFWNLVLPLLFMVGLSYIFGGGEPARVERIVPGILVINLLTMAFFGAALHMVSLRERGLYRQLRLTPIGPGSVVAAHALTALVNAGASTCLQLAAAYALFRIHVHGPPASVAAGVFLAAFAIIPLGLIVGSAARDMRVAPALSNLAYFPLLFLSGATMPLFLMPAWVHRVARLLPSTYAVELLQGVMLRSEPMSNLAVPAAILVLTGVVAFAADALLFRWETREPLNRRGLVLAAACLAIVYGAASASGVALESERPPAPEPPGVTVTPARPGLRVLTGLTILDGQGGRIERGRVIIEGSRIRSVGPDVGPLPAGVAATDLTGLYLIPGLIDSHVHIGGSAGGAVSSAEFIPSRVIRDLQVDLALGITSVVSMTDDIEDIQRLRRSVATGTMRSPRPFYVGPGITASGGHPAKYFEVVPGLAARMTRQVDTPEAAEAAVRELASLRVDMVKLFLEGGRAGEELPALPEPAFRAAVRTAKGLGLKTTVHVDTDRHARLAIDAGADGLEHAPADLSGATIESMAANRVTLTPTLAESEAMANAVAGAPVTDTLALEWVDPNVVASLRSPDSWVSKVRERPGAAASYARTHQGALDAARRAAAGGVTILAGSDAGNPAAFHGAALIRELELLVQRAGMAPSDALVAATGAAARRLGTADVGRIAPGAFADLVVLGADPSRDIRALRDVRAVYFGGVPLDRKSLLTTPAGDWMPRSGVETK
jgi:imidazolonepropionase-like amidohydrolase/ABC-type polysaccharide/polyol phosphate export permease